MLVYGLGNPRAWDQGTPAIPKKDLEDRIHQLTNQVKTSEERLMSLEQEIADVKKHSGELINDALDTVNQLRKSKQ